MDKQEFDRDQIRNLIHAYNVGAFSMEDFLDWTFRTEKYLRSLHQPERSKREDHESGCGALNSMET